MAQNDIQKYTTDQDFFNNIRNPLEILYNIHDKLEKMQNFLTSATPTDYPGITGQTLTDFSTLKTELNDYLAAQSTIDFMTEINKFVRI
jgi:hypothetical protein